MNDPPRPGSLAALALLAMALLPACVTDHDALARSPDPEPTTSPTGPAGSSGGAPGEAGAALPDSEPHLPPEPDGPRSLTVVNGVTDAPLPILLCVSRVEGATINDPAGAPFPPGGLAYGARVVIDDGDGLDLVNDGLRFHVIAGDLSLVSGLDCTAALAEAARIEGQRPAAPDGGPEESPDSSVDGGASDAAKGGGPVGDAAAPNRFPDAAVPDSGLDGLAPLPLPPIRARSLAVIPAGSLDDSRSFLMVLSGCMGGDAFTHESELLICGDSYRPGFPTLSPMVVALSRQVTVAKIGLQFVNASPAMQSAEIISAPNGANTHGDVEIATGAILGEIVPPVPSREESVGLLAANGDVASLLVRNSSGTNTLLDVPWLTVRDNAGIEILSDGENYTLVLAGPHPAQIEGPWWNAPVMTLVENDP